MTEADLGGMRRKRRRHAYTVAAFITLLLAVNAAGLMAVRLVHMPGGIGSTFLLVSALVELGMIVPVWIVLRIRLKEIERGEADAAAEY